MAQIKSYVKVVSFPELSVLNSEIPKVYWAHKLRMCGRNLYSNVARPRHSRLTRNKRFQSSNNGG